MATKAGKARDRLKDAKRSLYREAVLDAAERTFADVGYDAAKVADIAGAAGVSLMTFYSVFEKKWDVYRAVHARRLTALMGQIGSRRLDKNDVLGTLAHSVESTLLFHMEHPDYLRMHLRERIAWTDTEGLRAPEQTKAWTDGLVMMKAAFSAGIRQGIFIDDDVELMARTLIGMHQVRLAVWAEQSQKQLPAEVTRGALRQLIRSFCPTERVEEFMAQAGVSNERIASGEGDKQ